MLSEEKFLAGKVSPYLVWLCSESKQFPLSWWKKLKVIILSLWLAGDPKEWNHIGHFILVPAVGKWDSQRWLYPDQFWIIKIYVAKLECHHDCFVHESFGKERGSWKKIGLLLHDGSRKEYVWNSENCLECLTYFKPSMISGYVKCPSPLGSANILYIF